VSGAVLLGVLTVGYSSAPAACVGVSAGANAPGLFTAWVNGDVEQVVADLALAAPSRESQFNRATALLEQGHPETAERLFAALRASQPAWLPALRGLGRAQRALGRGELEATAQRLTRQPGATSRDFHWAGDVHLDAGRRPEAIAAFAAAVEREPDLYLGWLSLGDTLQSVGRTSEAVTAWRRAAALCATGDVLMRLGRTAIEGGRQADALELLQGALGAPDGARFEAEAERLAPGIGARIDASPFGRRRMTTLRAGEVLRFSVSYFSIGLGRIVLTNLGPQDAGGRQAHALRFSARSSPAIFFYRVRNDYSTTVTEFGAVIRHRNVSDDSTAKPTMNTYEMDDERGFCVWRYVDDGLIGIERLPLPPMAQDGVSTLALAREVASTRRPVSVLTAVAGTWKGTDMRVAGVERIRWRGREVEAVRVDICARYQGAAGFSGASSTWFSTDARAMPYRTVLKIPVGSVVMELESD
jgi:tetratricopeptide (TPR) repeat protein